jgi:tRNA/rRNA methyltransferase/tRNA (cytidine32/uridine32-2'-O)-methyltransferase
MDQGALEKLVRGITDSLESLGFYTQPGREEQERFFRDLFSRAGISAREGVYIDALFAKAAGLGRKGSQGGS